MATSMQFLGHGFELHQSNEGLSQELRMFGVHEPEATATYLKCLSPGDHVIDVGSNLGYYLLLAADRVGDTGRLLGFEPSPHLYKLLERNVVLSGHHNMHVDSCAIGAKSGNLEFYESKIPNWGSLFENADLQQTRKITVQARTLDEVVRETPGFHPACVRMDVEGAELMVLEGGRETLSQYKPILFIEFHNFALGWDAVRSALDDLRRLGYRSGKLIERTWDQPWIGKWMRARRHWKGDLKTLTDRVEDSRDPLVKSTLTFIISTAGA